MDDFRPISESTAVAVAEEQPRLPAPIEAGAPIMPIIPRDQIQAARLAGAIVDSGMVPNSYAVTPGKGEGLNKSPEECARMTRARVLMGIIKGLEVGLAPTTALSSIAIVNGRPSLWGDGAMALVRRSGKVEYIKEWATGTPYQDDWTAHCEGMRKGESAPLSRSFSWAEAKRARLTGKPGPWQDYPARMLAARARAWVLRDLFADALSGLSIGEEAQDIPPAPPPVTDTGFLDAGMPALPAPTGAEAQPDEHRRPKAEAAGSSPAGITTDPRGEGKAAAPEAPTGTAPKGAAADLLAWCPSPAKDEKDAAYKAGLIVAKLKPMDRDGRMEWLKRHGERYAEIVKRDPSQADGLKQFFEGGQ